MLENVEIQTQTDPPQVSAALMRLRMVITGLKQRIMDTSRSLEEEREKYAGLEQTKLKLETEHANATREVERQISAAKHDHETVRKQNDRLEQQLEELNAAHETKLDLAQTQMVFLTQQLQESIGERNTLSTDLERAREACRRAEQQQGALSELQGFLEAQCSHFDGVHQTVASLVTQTKAEAANVTERQARLQTAVDQLDKALKTETEGRVEAVNELEEARRTIDGLREAVRVQDARLKDTQTSRVDLQLHESVPTEAGALVPSLPEMSALPALVEGATAASASLTSSTKKLQSTLDATRPTPRPALPDPGEVEGLGRLRATVRALRARLEEESAKRCSAEGAAAVLTAKLEVADVVTRLNIPEDVSFAPPEMVTTAAQTHPTPNPPNPPMHQGDTPDGSLMECEAAPTPAGSGQANTVMTPRSTRRITARPKATGRRRSQACELCEKPVEGWGCVRCTGCGRRAHKCCAPDGYTCGACGQFGDGGSQNLDQLAAAKKRARMSRE